MIKDGLAEPKVARALKREGWRCISTAPIARRVWDGVAVVPAEIEGLTHHGLVVIAVYDPTGKDCEDRWTNRFGNTVYVLTHWRPLQG